MHLIIPPLLLTGIFILLMLAISWFMPQLIVTIPGKNIFSSLAALTGTGFCGLAIAMFRKANTTTNPMKPGQTSQLVASGIFRLSRNPMYVGFLLFLIAWALYSAHLLNLFVLPPMFVIYMNRFQIIPEETALSLKFGEDFDTYRRAVRRWI